MSTHTITERKRERERVREREMSGQYLKDVRVCVTDVVNIVWTCVDPFESGNVQVQAMELLPLLRRKIPIARAKMRLRAELASAASLPKLEARLEADVSASITPRAGGNDAVEQRVLVFLVEPGMYRRVAEIVGDAKGRLEVLEMAAVDESDSATPAPMSVSMSAMDKTPDDTRDDGNSATSSGTSNTAQQQQQQKGKASSGTRGGVLSSKMRCTTCLIAFSSPQAHREHFKSDLHRVNIKRKSRGEEPVGEEECEAMMMLMESEAERRRGELDEFC